MWTVPRLGNPGLEVQPLKDDLFTSSLRNTQELVGNAEPQATSRPTWVIIGLLTRSAGDSYTHLSLRCTGQEQNLSGLWVSTRILIGVLPFGVEDPKFGSNRRIWLREENLKTSLVQSNKSKRQGRRGNRGESPGRLGARRGCDVRSRMGPVVPQIMKA